MDQPQRTTPSSEPWTETDEVEVSGDAEGGEAISLQITRFLRLIWVKRRMVFGILATGMLLSLLCALSLPSMYTSTTTLMPSDSSSSSANLMSLLSSAGPVASIGSGALGIKTPGAVFVGILGSRNVQEGVVKQFDLAHHYKTRFVEDACKRLAAASSIKEDPKNGIITISVKANDPALASKIAQGYVTELDRVVTNNSTSAARRERMFLEGRLKEIKQNLDDSAKTLSQFSTKNKTIDIPSQGKAMVESELKLQDQMAIARSELAGLQQSYSADNVRVRAAHARIAELQREIDKTMGTAEEPKSETSDSAYPSLSELPSLGVTYYDLERKMRVQEALWEALTKQYEAARVQEAKEIPAVRVLDAANVPERKSPSARKIIVILGTAFSFLIACVVVFVTNVWEEMDPQNEGKVLVTEVWNGTLNSLAWVCHLPGMRWVCARFEKSK
jgi:uncharacterized protein involved in exopolysaccharide biosynthesis